MCGIFGYIGTKPATPLLLDGLRTLEYRGYDSAGIFVPGAGAVKAVGPIASLAEKIDSKAVGTSGIAHTRWATHGAPTELNAHPHHSFDKKIWIVHNGIIENYQALKTELTQTGITVESDTDTEVLAKLIGQHYQRSLLEAVQTALKKVRGTYGLAVMSVETPGEIVVARMGSPIVLGITPEARLVASDSSALLAHTKEVVYLNDGELAVLTKDSHQIMTLTGSVEERGTETLEWELETVQKQGYEHFMQKEIFEAPQVIRDTLRGRLIEETGKAKLGGLETVLKEVLSLNRLTIAGCGSAYYAGYVGKYLLERYAGLPVEIELASEYRYKTNHPGENNALLAVTQSGETADTLAAVRLAKELGQLTLGVVNVVGSTIARETDAGVYNHAGPEVAVASTKAFISQLTVMALLTLLIGRERGLSESEGKAMVEALDELPDVIERMLAGVSAIERVAKKYAAARDFMFIGRTTHTPVAFEGALKLKEVTYIHAEAYAGGELKHGPIALLDEQFPVFALAPDDDVYDKMVSNIEEVKARKAPVIALTSEGNTQLASLVDDVLYIPKVHPLIQPIVSTIPLHLFAYFVGVHKGLNVDRPRNLAKSVTVE